MTTRQRLTAHRSLAAFVALVVAVSTAACARKGEPLPGDSVAPDGAVAVAPPAPLPMSAAASATKEPLGAVESRLFPPELIMQHQGELALDDAQRKVVQAEMERAQTDMTKLRWDLEREREALVKLLDADHGDEVAIGVAAKRMTDLESKVKAVHLTMLVRIKNVLTTGQKAFLREHR